MDLYNLGTVDWLDSQLLYHALAYLGREGLILLQPGTPYVSLGFHQDANQEVEMDYLEEQGIPIFRREVGGGAVYLDRGQLFYQLVLRADRPDVPASKDAFYRKFLGPVVETFREMGVEATFKPVNDIIVNNRKISGNGAAEINDMMILVGNFLIDFNYEMMAKSLRVPDEKFRDKVQKSMAAALTTLTQELDQPPTIETLSERLVARYIPLLGEFQPREVDAELRAEADRLWREKFSARRLADRERPPQPRSAQGPHRGRHQRRPARLQSAGRPDPRDGHRARRPSVRRAPVGRLLPVPGGQHRGPGNGPGRRRRRSGCRGTGHCGFLCGAIHRSTGRPARGLRRRAGRESLAHVREPV